MSSIFAASGGPVGGGACRGRSDLQDISARAVNQRPTMSGVKSRLEPTADNAKRVESPRIELERCQRELEACRLRLGELEQGEALLAGENRLLEMVAKGEGLSSILDGICGLVEAISAGFL